MHEAASSTKQSEHLYLEALVHLHDIDAVCTFLYNRLSCIKCIVLEITYKADLI